MQVLDTKSVCERGQALYDERLKSRLEPAQDGNYVAVDIDSGEYVLATSGSEALSEARKSHPDRVFYLVCVGRRVADFRRGFR